MTILLCSKTLVKVKDNERADYRIAGGTAGRSDRKGSASMFNRIKTAVGWALVMLAYMALAVGMVIAVASSEVTIW